MQCKYKKDCKQFSDPPEFVDTAAFFVLFTVVQIIDLISILLGCGEIWITCFIDYRPYKSQHPKGLAVDIRCHQKGIGAKPVKWYWMMKWLGKALNTFNRNIVFVMHESVFGKKNEHVHVEVRTGAKI